MFLYLVVGISSLSIIGFYAYFKAKEALIMRATEQLNSVKTFKKAQIENYLKNMNNPVSAFDSLSIAGTVINFDEINKIMLDTNQTNGLGKTGEVYLVGDDYFMKSKSRFYFSSMQPIKVETQAVKCAFNKGSGTSISND